MTINTDDWSYRYQYMKAELECALSKMRQERDKWRLYGEDQYRRALWYYNNAMDYNNQLLHEYGLEGEADARDIIMRQQAALMNMRECNDNLRLRNRGLEEDMQQLEDHMDGIDAGYDFWRHGPGL